MKVGEIYAHNETLDIIEIVCVRSKNKRGMAEVCWSTVNSQESKDTKAMSFLGQFGWNTKVEINYNYTMVGGL